MTIAWNKLDSNKDHTHIQITAQGCELIMTVSSDCLTAMQTRCRKTPFPESEKRPVWYEYSDDLEENLSQTVTHDRRQLNVKPI